MDWNLAIEINREALRRVVAMLVAMVSHSAIGSWQSDAAPTATGPTDCPLPTGGCRFTLPRHLHRAVLRLLRPAESAARRLIIVFARGIVAAPGAGRRPARPTTPHTREGELARALPSPLWGGSGSNRSEVEMARRGDVEAAKPSPVRRLALPLLDPLKPSFRRKRPTPSAMPRISLPGFTRPFPIKPRPSLTPGDALDATRLGLRLRALVAALDDLPAQARRFARWRARSTAANGTPACRPKKFRRAWPLRPGRPPGALRRPGHEVHDILGNLQGLARRALEQPDTS